ncbi:MAG: phosphatidylserine decarboxylase [Eubacteriales bacterium]|nr:phosphatidylserine decarboxylase [Eubacteriales bacterium]
MNDSKAMKLFYGSALGRGFLNILMKIGLPKAIAAFLCSPLSKPMVGKYIRKYDIDMDEYPNEKYRNFSDFFVRRKCDPAFDGEPTHLISPCDSMLSFYPIDEGSCFGIKNSSYRVCDLVGDEALGREYLGGSCLVFRLRPNDYHRYCFIDSGFVGENRFFEGKLHSVQPIACRKVPVYRLNRRLCTVLETENFGKVIQTAVGAMAVGGIVNLFENCHVSKGGEMGRFELCGSTIVLLFQKGKISLLPEHERILQNGGELPVRYGEHIGNSI